MLVKDGQEIKPDEEPGDDREPEVELTDDEVVEALRLYAEYKNREKTQQLKPVQKQAQKPEQKPAQKQEDDGYGDYKFVEDDDEELVGLPAFIASVKQYKSAILIVVAVLAGVVILFAAVSSWKSGSGGAVQPTSATQAVQSSSDAGSGTSCTVVNSTIASKEDVKQGEFFNCTLVLSSGATVTYPGACEGISLQVGDTASYCK